MTINQKTLLASVAFELIKKPAPNTTLLSVSLVKVINDVGAPIGVAYTPPSPDTITINDAPPIASFTAIHLPTGDASCMPVIGAPCSSYAFRFDGTASSDPAPGSIANPVGYFWDFGDGTQDSVNAVSTCAILNCNQGRVAIHDYDFVGDTAGPYYVTLRVVDDSGNTGSARDAFGIKIVDAQPSHTYNAICIRIDVNLNGVVDITDLVIVNGAFLSTPSSARWNPKADMNGDGIVDISDVVIVASHFLQSCAGE